MLFFFKLNRKILKARELYGNWMIWRFKAEMSWLPKSSESLTIRRSSRIFPTEENVPTVRDFLFFKKKKDELIPCENDDFIYSLSLCKLYANEATLQKNLNLIHLKLKRKIKAGNEKWISDFFFCLGGSGRPRNWRKIGQMLSAHWRESGGGAGHVRGTSDPLHTHTHTHTHRTLNCYQNIVGLHRRSIAQLNWNLNLIGLKLIFYKIQKNSNF